ncbi:MAG: methylated-DNA--[protein]-cysteine S-methyltransferase [Candidatus Peribacteraceae bacterium]|nr:methylated-DNA--[protein]-cysteine S-methyltransferase [Candidatus Peribacteraceae bacterium]
MPRTSEITVQPPLGPLLLRADEQGMTEVRFVRNPCRRGKASALLRTAQEQIRASFAGTRRTFSLPLHIRGTAFERAVWRALARVPYGTVVTYGELAREIGKPRAMRAVGTALRKNPLAILLPCHRVIPSRGGTGRYAGGAWRKAWLIAHEKQCVQRREKQGK